MSMLSAQIKELRETAVSLGVNGVCTGDLSKLYVMLREAADTIEKLESHSNQLEPSRWHELFGTPERTVRTLLDYNAFKQCVDCPVCHDEYGETCEIPGDCAFVMCDYHKLLEWLRGDA